MFAAVTAVVMMLWIDRVSCYTKVTTDFDLYGIKVAMNDRLAVTANNLQSAWFCVNPATNDTSYCTLYFNNTECDFVYSVIVPRSNSISFVYNCINIHGNNLVGYFNGTHVCNMQMSDEKIVSNYSTQDNFVIAIDGDGTGVYGFADDFVFFYDLQFPFPLTIWPNQFNISPRGLDIGANMQYAAVVGYCQMTPSIANECGFIMILNNSSSCPIRMTEIPIDEVLYFNWSDPRNNHLVTQSRVYSSQAILSVSIAWKSERLLVGVPSLNIVLLYSFGVTPATLQTHQNGAGLTGFGKSVAWLDDQGEKAVILANSYSYSTDQWISSAVHVYDIASDGFSDGKQPVLIYPNSQQIIFPWTTTMLLCLVCTATGNLVTLDTLGNAAAIISVPAGFYPDTNSNKFSSNLIPCIRGTRRNYAGIELCTPCPNGTFSSICQTCSSNDSFCPYGSVQDLSYSAFPSIEQDRDYPESPENTVFDDLLMQNIFSLNTQSTHCLLVSPMMWVIGIIGIGTAVAIAVAISEFRYPNTSSARDQVKKVFKRMDLIGEGELWIGGLVSAAIMVLIVSAYSFSNGYFHQYPVEGVKGDSSFACDVTIRNAKFSTTVQIVPSSRSSTQQNQPMFDLLNSQQLYLMIDFVQTAFTCQDSLIAYRLIGDQHLPLPISTCETSHNQSILSLTVPLPSHTISLQLTLPGSRTVGAIRLGLYGPSAISADGRYTLLELNSASAVVSSSLDQVLARSTSFSLQLTSIVNQTAPLNSNGVSTFSAIWSPTFDIQADVQFVTETRYTFFQRLQTNVTITIQENVFYISNTQEPIARQREIIFHNLLFTIVVLEVRYFIAGIDIGRKHRMRSMPVTIWLWFLFTKLIPRRSAGNPPSPKNLAADGRHSLTQRPPTANDLHG